MKDSRMTRSILLWLLIFMTLQGEVRAMADQSPEQVLAGFQQRVDAVFYAEQGKPLVRAKKETAHKPGRGNNVRHYSYSILAFAGRCLYLDEMAEEANAALVENAQYYLDNPLSITDRDSYHWHADIVLRLLEMYGPNGRVHAGRITRETESKVLEPMWIYTKECSWLGKAEYNESKTWQTYGSENHHAMDFSCLWHFCKYAKDRPEYKDLKCDDGATLAEHYQAWDDYIVEYCRERAKKSMCVEMRHNGYNPSTIRGFYNFYDFGEPRLRRAAGMYLDLYFAYWAEEQILGHMGGGGSRARGNNAFTQSRTHGNAPLAWFYFAIGKQSPLFGHDLNAALSGYRPPAVVADIALDTEGRGRYEVRQRVQGLGKPGHTFPHMNRPDLEPPKMRTDGGGIVRYSYCDPAFILGTPMTEARPLSDWVPISSQNRWQGVIFAGQHDPRIVPIARPRDNITAFNGQWSVQSKGSLITQKLKYHKGAAEMMVWISREGLSQPVTEDNVVYVEAPGAYAAIRVGKGGYKLEDKRFTYEKPPGKVSTTPRAWIVTPDDEYTPVILEVMAKSDVENLAAFKAKVQATKPSIETSTLTYTTIYGDTLTLDISYQEVPTINGKPVDYAPKKVFDSPFLNADYNSGVVTISKGTRNKVLDFNHQ